MPNSSLNIETKSKFTADGWEPQYCVSFRGDKSEAMRMVEQFMQPLPASKIAELIARLQVIAPEREKSTYDIKARLAIWVEELLAYPADIVTRALKGRYRWFPSLAEVLEKCDNEVAYRKLIAQGIRCSRTDLDMED